MKKVKFTIMDWVFGILLELLFKFSTQYKLVKFDRSENNDVINYQLSIETKRPISKSLIEVEQHTSEYFKNVVRKNTEVFKIRVEIMNFSQDKFDIINKKVIIHLDEDPYILTTVEDFFKEIGFSKNMFFSTKNEEESRFMTELQKYASSK